MQHQSFKYKASQRSKYQIETQTDYNTNGAGKGVSSSIETYLFIPSSAGINRKTYPADLHYQDLQNSYRLKLASTSLSSLGGTNSPTLHLLQDSATALGQRKGEAEVNTTTIRHRLFGQLVSETVEALLQETRNLRVPEVLRQRAQYFLDNAETLATRLRATYVAELATIDPYSQAFSLCDEHVSLTLEQATYELLELLERHGKSSAETALNQALLDFSRKEASYRLQRGYSSKATAKRKYEELIYRKSALDQYMKSTLYLSSRHKPDSVVTRELILSVAAGLAMVFATAVAFIAHVQYENWTTTFFVVLVISYMFKDRIKAQSQSYLNHRSKRFFFDYRTSIFGMSTPRAIGVKRELMQYVHPDKIDPAIMAERVSHRHNGSSIGCEHENILCYKRQTHIFTTRLTESYQGFPVEGIENQSRYNFSHLTAHMQDSKTILRLAEGDHIQKIRGRRVYHFHVIAKTQHQGKQQLHHYCIVINREGIKRVIYY